MSIHPPPPFRDLGPAALARARSIVDVTEIAAERFRPAITAAHWDLLKEARGQKVDHDRLGQTAFIIAPRVAAPAPAPTFVETIDTIRQRVMDRIHQRSEAMKRGPETGGAA